MRIDIITIFPEYFTGPFSHSIIKRAQYIYEQLKLPEEERVLSVPDGDKEQIMHKPCNL